MDSPAYFEWVYDKNGTILELILAALKGVSMPVLASGEVWVMFIWRGVHLPFCVGFAGLTASVLC